MYNLKIFILFLTITSIFCINTSYASDSSLPLLGKVIYIDPGHGGTDPGAIYKDIHESDINLSISKKLYDILLKEGAIVYMTRDGDYDLSVTNAINRKRSDLSRRANAINTSMCDMYVSIHLNAESSSTWYGAQVFYDDVNPENKKIAEIMQAEFSKTLKTKREYKETNEMYLHKRVERPGVLAEVGFLTNPNERYLLMQDTYQQKIALTIYNAIEKYFN